MFTMTLYTLVMIFRIIFAQNFQWISSLHFLGFIEADYTGVGLTTVLFLDVCHDNPETYHTVIWLCTLYISFSVCGPYALCTLYRQCEPFCWDLMSLYLNNNFTVTLCVAQTSDVSFWFWISSVLPVMQLVL